MTDSQELSRLTAIQAAEAIRAGDATSEELVASCAGRIAEVDETVQAWAYFDRDYALEQARDRHLARQAGQPLGPLHGIPVGIKDIVDTGDMPTEYGSPVRAGHRPSWDATAVARLREAGAIVMGKTATTEFALYTPGKTTNPHDPKRTPGGSSSGSAAAVASHMAPLAIGSQTNGSVIRPAAYCGIYGFKPSHGLISRWRVLPLSRSLDHIGVFARSIEDIALVAETLIGFDHNDPDTRPRARPELLRTALGEPPLTPRLAFVKQPAWEDGEDDMHQAFAELVDYLGAEVIEEVDLPAAFGDAHGCHRTIMEADIAKNLGSIYDRAGDTLSPRLREIIERGRTVTAVDYGHAMDQTATLGDYLGEVLSEFDAIVTPAAAGEAPLGLDSTGSPAFCTIWTLCGTPAITLPILEGSNGMPMGVQLVGRVGDDARLLRTARWFVGATETSGEDR